MAVWSSFGFPPQVRLRRRQQFNRIRSVGRKTHTAHFIIFVQEQGHGPARLGVTASRKVGGAVQRNRVKRLVREFFRRHQLQLPAGTDFSVIAKWGASSLDFHKVCDELGFLCIPTGATCSEKSPSV